MEFFLKYQGELKSNASPEEKHELRKIFHRQLDRLFRIDPALKERENWKVSTISDSNTVNCIVQKKGFLFAPLISSQLNLMAEVDITILWADAPGQIIGNGDIDNKLKTLFDALSCPPHDNQLDGQVPASGETPFYCLLEDDKLIQNVNIRTHTLLDCTDRREIFVLVHVRSKATRGTWGNIGL